MDLIAFCHIRWNFVYQRPQHLLNRFAFYNRVFVIEEPVYGAPSTYYEIKKSSDDTNLWVVVMHLANDTTPEETNSILKGLINSMIHQEKIKSYILWYYSPMALAYSDHLSPSLIVYDCMDELSAFANAPARIREREKELLHLADVVFTGGHSLYNAKKHLHHNIHAFPSSIDKSHFMSARTQRQDPEDQASIPGPRFGFYGVIDERFDIRLLDELATRKPEWHFVIIGPVVKINPAHLPVKDNIHYLGAKKYDDLPKYLSGWDVAILPFALNESTRFISPTKTPEYLAGGKPVISTSIEDVVNPYEREGLVHIADTADEFIAAAEKILTRENEEKWLAKTDAFLAGNSWNDTWHKMTQLIDKALENKKIRNNKIEKSYV